MKLAPIIHQQLMQLRWHIAACIGLMMAMPLEDAIVNLWQGQHGFYAGSLSLAVPLVASPLLAALIACANVQADFDDRRYTFWRSKPASIMSFMVVKYVIGLIAACAVIASPFMFAFFTCRFVKPDEIERGFYEAVIMVQSVSLLTYSLCFLCSVLIRKTARAWLVGMALTCFLMIIPFMLPLNLRTVDDVFHFLGTNWSFIWAGYCLTGVPSLAAFILAIIAAARNWRLHTNLKGLLWTAAGLALALMLLFSRQIANIKVLDEVEIPRDYHYSGDLQRLYSNTKEGHLLEIDASAGKIELNEIYREPSEETLRQQKTAPRLYPVHEGLALDIYPDADRITFDTGTDTFLFTLNAFYDREQIRKNAYQEKLKNAYLCGYKLLEGLYPVSVSALDLSDCVDDPEGPRKIGMRRIDDRLVVLIQKSVAVVQIKPDGSLELVDKQIGGLKGYSRTLTSRDKLFKVPLVPIQGLSAEERIKLTIDIHYRYYKDYLYNWQQGERYRRSLVDINDDRISFYLLSGDEIARFDVVKWDDKYVYCSLRDTRPFTFLEQMFNQIHERDISFVQDGKLYAFTWQKLLVFDIRSDHIRKLGHFERIQADYAIWDIEVLPAGDILLYAKTEKRILEKSDDPNYKYKDCFILQNYLSLLENPE